MRTARILVVLLFFKTLQVVLPEEWRSHLRNESVVLDVGFVPQKNFNRFFVFCHASCMHMCRSVSLHFVFRVRVLIISSFFS